MKISESVIWKYRDHGHVLHILIQLWKKHCLQKQNLEIGK